MRKIGHVLPGAMSEKEVLRAGRAQRILRRWSEVVGDGLAARSRPDRYQNGTVWVAVESSAWAQELRMRKDTILERLNGMTAETGLFQDVRFGVRPLPPQEPAVPEPEFDRGSYEGLSIREIAERRLSKWNERPD